MIYRVLCWILTLYFAPFYGQQQEASIKMIAFYNVENLFYPRSTDSVNENSYSFDKPGWNRKKYEVKLRNLARVIRSVGEAHHIKGPHLIGLAEVQNFQVLRDLQNHPLLDALNYGIIHYDSPDHRGIDVALLYRKEDFIPLNTESRHVLLRNREGYVQSTRDILVVSGYFEQELIHLLVNHWPSRRGGKTRSEPLRRTAALINKKIIDSLKWRYSDPFIVSMGDFNDDPDDVSIHGILGGRTFEERSEYGMINPMLPLFRKGYGSLAYRDRWHLFDQILLSKESITQGYGQYRFLNAGIYMPKWIRVERGRYQGYPKRTYTGNTYTGGYSDHFPVYLIFEPVSVSGQPDIIGDPGKDKH